MTSTILYKFRSGTNFEALQLPGTSARLFDVKRGIVRAKKLDRSTGGAQLEFDLSVQNAMTNEAYDDEQMLLPRGTRVVVRRVTAERGHGLLARIARAEAGVTPSGGPQQSASRAAADDGFYTIHSREREEDDEFIDGGSDAKQADDANELEALRAVTDQAGSMYGPGGGRPGNKVWTTGMGTAGGVPPPPPPPRGAGGGPPGGAHGHHFHHNKPHGRPNADPELREQERREQQQNKPKRATGIPRTFLNLSAPPATDGSIDKAGENADGAGDAGGASTLSRLQPNTIGFEALVHRAGGQSETGAGGKRRDLDYALKLTATSIPEHLECGICHSVVKNAMLVPWDPEGRTTCETCIRDGLTQSGFRCPLTGQDGVSPDDLLPNHGLRKAADLFVQGVMEKMEQIVQQQEADEEQEKHQVTTSGSAAVSGTLEGDSGDKGVVLTRKAARQGGRLQKEDDPFGDDEFGGDVFDVATDELEGGDDGDALLESVDDADSVQAKTGERRHSEDTVPNSNKSVHDESDQKGENRGLGAAEPEGPKGASEHSRATAEDQIGQQKRNSDLVTADSSSPPSRQEKSRDEVQNSSNIKQQDSSVTPSPSNSTSTARRDVKKRRGPPAGYVMGPAGGATTPTKSFPDNGEGKGGDQFPPDPRFVSAPPPPAPSAAGRSPGGRGHSIPAPHAGGRGGEYAPYHHSSRPPFRGGRGGGWGNRFASHHDQQAGAPPQSGGGYRGRGGRGNSHRPYSSYGGGRGYMSRGGGMGADDRMEQQQHVDGHSSQSSSINRQRGTTPKPDDSRGVKRTRNERENRGVFDDRNVQRHRGEYHETAAAGSRDMPRGQNYRCLPGRIHYGRGAPPGGRYGGGYDSGRGRGSYGGRGRGGYGRY